MDILKAYSTLQQSQKLPEMHPGGVKVSSQRYADTQALWAALESHHPTQGWLMFQSTQMPFHDGLPQRQPDWGWLLACEAVNADGDSLAILQDGQGGWRLIEYIADADMHGLWDEMRQIVHAKDTGELCYRRYWVDEQEQGFVQKHACFIGFK